MKEYIDFLELPDKRIVKFSKTASSRDFDSLKRFIAQIPEEDLLSVNINKNDAKTIDCFISSIKAGRQVCLTAEFDDNIMAGFTVLKLPEYGWMRNIAEIQGIVHPDFRKLGIAKKLLHAIFRVSLAENEDIMTLIIRTIEDDSSSSEALEPLGFRKNCVLKGFARDIVDRKKDLIIYALDVNEFWSNIAYGKQFGRSMED